MLDLQYRLPKDNTLTTPYVDTYTRQAFCMLTMRKELCQKVRHFSSHLFVSPSFFSGGCICLGHAATPLEVQAEQSPSRCSRVS